MSNQNSREETNMRANRRSFLKTGGALAVISAIGAGSGAARAAEELNWSIHCDLTGPAAEGGKPQGMGFRSYADWINAKGGIRGRMINLTINDSTFKVDVAVANVKKALARGRVDFLFGESTGMIQAITPENNSTNKILMTSGSMASELADQAAYPYHFVPGATYGAQLRLLGVLQPYLPEQPWFYDAETLTDRSERFLVSEVIREKLFRLTGDELPYNVTVVIDSFAEESTMRRIAATIIVERDAHKGMVIGAKGLQLKRIASESRQELERLLEAKVFLEVWVKVRSGWADSEEHLRSYGYE